MAEAHLIVQGLVLRGTKDVREVGWLDPTCGSQGRRVVGRGTSGWRERHVRVEGQACQGGGRGMSGWRDMKDAV